MTHSLEFEAARDNAMQRLAMIAWVAVPVAPATAWAVGNNPVTILILGVVFATLGTLGARSGGANGRAAVGLALTGQAIAFTASLAGHPWQLDSHMVFFVYLAMTIALSDVRVVVLCTIAIAAHHAVLSVAVPALVYPSTEIMGNLVRTAFHGFVVVLEAAALVWAIAQRNRMDAVAVARQSELAKAHADAEDALARAEASHREAEAALAGAQESARTADEMRRTAESESARAREADRIARETETAEVDRRRAAEALQASVFETLRAALHEFSEGRLDIRIDQVPAEQYEGLRRDFNAAVTRLGDAIAAARASAAAITNEARHISDAAGELSRRTETQAATLQETVASVGQVAASVRSTAEGARRANTVVTEARDKAQSSGAVVRNAVDAMGQIAASSDEITKIIRVIDDIAFQTNLLALNAGVEAARAGDAGRGFAVVASEVRALAQRSSEAARQIGNLISTSGDQVSRGVDLVGEAGHALGLIVSSVTDIAAHVSGITALTQEQATSLAEIDTAMQQLDQVTQHNAGMHEESSAASLSLRQEADSLSRSMAHFRTGSSSWTDPEALRAS